MTITQRLLPGVGIVQYDDTARHKPLLPGAGIVQHRGDPTLGDRFVFFYEFQEASDLGVDSTHYKHGLGSAGSPTTTTGLVGNAVGLNGTTQYLSVASTAHIQGRDELFGFVGVFHIDAAVSGYRNILSKVATFSTDSFEYQVTVDVDSGALLFAVGAGGGVVNFVATDSFAITTGVTYTFRCWHDPVADKLYLQVDDGAVLEADYASGSYASSAPLEIGRIGGVDGNTQYWDGWADQLGMFRETALTDDEWSWLYNGGAFRTWAEIEAYLPDEGAAEATADVAFTDATDTIVAEAVQPLTADVAFTDATDTIVAEAVQPLTADVAFTDATDTIVAEAVLPLTADVAFTDTDDTIVAEAVQPLTADVAFTDTDDTIVAEAAVVSDVDVVFTDDADTITAEAAVTSNVDVVFTDDNDTITAEAAVTSNVNVVFTDAEDVIEAEAALPLSADIEFTDDDDVIAAEAEVSTPTGPGPHIYWRWRPAASWPGGTVVGSGEITMRTSIGGADAITGTNYSDNSPTGDPAWLHDASLFSSWTVTPDGSYWWQYQFSSAVEIVEWTLQQGTFLASVNSPSHHFLEYSDDGVSWTVAQEVIETTQFSANETRTYTVPASGESGSEADVVFTDDNDIIEAEASVEAEPEPEPEPTPTTSFSGGPGKPLRARRAKPTTYTYQAVGDVPVTITGQLHYTLEDVVLLAKAEVGVNERARERWLAAIAALVGQP